MSSGSGHLGDFRLLWNEWTSEWMSSCFRGPRTPRTTWHWAVMSGCMFLLGRALAAGRFILQAGLSMSIGKSLLSQISRHTLQNGCRLLKHQQFHRAEGLSHGREDGGSVRWTLCPLRAGEEVQRKMPHPTFFLKKIRKGSQDQSETYVSLSDKGIGKKDPTWGI